MIAAAVFAPGHGLFAAAEQERHVEALGMFVEHAQVELHHIPADDRIGVMGGQPLVEAFEQLAAGVAVVELEVHRVALVRRAEHVHLTLAAAFEGDGIQIALSGGLDVQGHQFERRAVVGRRVSSAPRSSSTAGIGRAVEPHRGR